MSNTIISVQMPYCVLSAGSDLQSLFDYSVPEMVGKSILKLAGSRTDLTLLQTSIESFSNSCKREAITMWCTLYNRAGAEQDTLLILESHIQDGRICCLLGFKAFKTTNLLQSRMPDNFTTNLCTKTNTNAVCIDVGIVQQISHTSSDVYEQIPTSPVSIIITPALLQSLPAVPLSQAAHSVGISAYALKRACRRLGMRRWPYTRGKSKGTLQEAKTSSVKGSEHASRSHTEASLDWDAARNSTENTGGVRMEENFESEDCWKLCEWLADGCRELENEWARVLELKGESEERTMLADDLLVLDMLAKPWIQDVY